MADDLEIYTIDFVTSEPAAFDAGLDLLQEFVVQDVPELVVDGVVEVYVFEIVDVEIHLVVGAEPVRVHSEERHLCQDVVHRGHGHARGPLRGDPLADLVRAGVAEAEHSLVDREPLGRGLEGMPLQDRLEPIHRGEVFRLRVHYTDNLTHKVK